MKYRLTFEGYYTKIQLLGCGIDRKKTNLINHLKQQDTNILRRWEFGFQSEHLVYIVNYS